MNWNYISGFFDADGCITFVRNSKKVKKTVQISFTNTDRNILEQIKDFIQKETGVKGYIVASKQKQAHHLVSYYLNYNFLPCLLILQHINSIHLHKQRKIQLCLDKLAAITPRNGKYTDEKNKERELFELEFFSL